VDDLRVPAVCFNSRAFFVVPFTEERPPWSPLPSALHDIFHSHSDFSPEELLGRPMLGVAEAFLFATLSLRLQVRVG